MIKKIKLVVVAFAMLALAACGGGNSTQGGGYLTHGQAAAEFVKRLNFDLGYNVSLQKTYTLQDGYIVVYDGDYITDDAYYIGDWIVGEDLANYVAQTSKFYDLDYLGANVYEDFVTGIQFNKNGSRMSQEQVTYVKSKIARDGAYNMANGLVENYGVEPSLAMSAAPSILHFAANYKSMSDSEIDSFTVSLTGFSYTEISQAAKEGRADELFENSPTTASLQDPDAIKALLGL